MKRPLAVVRGDDGWLQERLEQAGGPVRAPRGFSQRVMNAVYREALQGTPAGEPAAEPSPSRVSRLYRRLALSFMLTGAVLAASLLVPGGAYPILFESGGAAAGLGTAASTAVQSLLLGAADAIQGALGERTIGGDQQ
jgi:hypothetical protein